MDRLLWADHVKAFSIWLMVLCHFGMHNEYWETVIYSFHMPVFFFISGYFDKGIEFGWGVLKKSFKSLIVPYFFFSICSFSICWISPYIHPEIYHNGTIPESFLKAFVGMFLMEDQVRSYAFMPLGPLWFLVSLCWVRVFFSIGCSIMKRNGFYMLPFGLILFLLFWYRFPWFSLDSACLALPVYVMGYLCNRYALLRNVGSNLTGSVFALCSILYVLFVSVHNGRVDVDGCVYGDSLAMFYINALIGSLACIAVFRLLNIKSQYLGSIGVSTITILGTHAYFGRVGIVIGVLFLSIIPGNIQVWFSFLWSIIAICLGKRIHQWLFCKYPALIGK